MKTRLFFAAVLWVALTAGISAVSYGYMFRSYGGAITAGFSGVSYGQFAKYGNGACPAAKCISSDTWYNSWADDDAIYTAHGDTTTGWNGAGPSLNLIFSTLSSYVPATMTGTMVGNTTAWGSNFQAGSDSADYKPSGVMAVHGTLYMFVYRHAQTGSFASLSAQLLKSANHGVTWTPAPPATAQPYASPMFTDQKFRMPAFVQYPTKDYFGQSVDRSDQYVYATSAETGNNAPNVASDTMYLGRVPISTIGNQSAADWQFYQGGDGALDANWGALATTVPVINESGCACHWNQQGLLYLPHWNKYILIDYRWGPLPTTVWGVYQGEHPWGPWVKRQSNTWASPGNAQTLSSWGFYFFGAVAKSAVADGGQTFTLLTAGDYTQPAQYTMYIVPVTVNP